MHVACAAWHVQVACAAWHVQVACASVRMSHVPLCGRAAWASAMLAAAARWRAPLAPAHVRIVSRAWLVRVHPCVACAQVLAAAASWCALLNGAGRSRQLVAALTIEQVQACLPALHAAMGES